MKGNSLKQNYIYNVILMTANMIFPLITSPYLSSILGAENIGKINYATSIINWFILFATFGIPRYGVREIARNRYDRKKMSMSFWNLIIIQLILSIIALIFYLIIIFSIESFENNFNLYMLMIVMLILNVFSIDWFYQGIEEYGYITIRNIIVKLISILLIFIMVKHREDYLIYALINIIGLSFNNVLNYIHTKKYVDNKVYKFKLLYYFKQLKVYFMTTLVVALYATLDQTMIGIKSQVDLAYYLRSKTIQSIGFNITSSIVTVFIPRTSYLIQKNYCEYKKIIQKSINYIYILALPCMVGILLLAKEIMLLLGKEEFLLATPSLQIISSLILITSVGSWQVNQILIPNGLEKLAFRMQLGGAILSIILNMLLISKFSYIGASIVWVVTETSLAIVGLILIKIKCKNIKINYINKSFIKYMISVIIMGIGIIILRNIINNCLLLIILSIIISPIVYFGMIIILKDDILVNMILGLKNNLISKKFSTH
ncbi:flippase [Clostridium sp. CTA-5]